MVVVKLKQIYENRNKLEGGGPPTRCRIPHRLTTGIWLVAYACWGPCGAIAL